MSTAKERALPSAETPLPPQTPSTVPPSSHALGAGPDMASSQDVAPKDAMIIASILKSMGVKEYDERVIPMLMEFLYRYIAESLEDARGYAEFADRGTTTAGGAAGSTPAGANQGTGQASAAASAGATGSQPSSDSIDIEDVKMAIQSKSNFSFSQVPPREVLAQLARERNSVPLPPLDTFKPGVQLPPEAYQLTAHNYQIRAAAKKPGKAKAGLGVLEPKKPPGSVDPSGAGRVTTAGAGNISRDANVPAAKETTRSAPNAGGDEANNDIGAGNGPVAMTDDPASQDGAGKASQEDMDLGK